MRDIQENGEHQQTVLIIHHDPAVLLLVKHILSDEYRVLLATSAESAVRLAMLEDVPMDLALLGRNTPGVRNSWELQRRLLALRPELSILPVIGLVKDGVIRLRMPGISTAHSGDLLDEVRWELNVRSLNRTAAVNFIADASDQPAAGTDAPLMVRAGGTVQ
jgi:CheY-like chemotaxis protein